MSVSYASIPLSDLLVDVENPRLDVQTNQRDAIRAVARDQGAKLVKLCRDIVDQKSLSPLDRFMVMLDSKGKYVVLEGNRRIVALKVLDNPGLVDGALNANNRASLGRLAKRYATSPIDDIDCAIVPDRDTARHWILLRHTGENQGAGTIKWKSSAADNFRTRFGQRPKHLRVLDFILQSSDVSEDVKDLARNMAVTNLDRLVGDPYVRGRIGIEAEHGTGIVLSKHSDKEIAQALEHIVRDFTEGGKTVASIDNKALRKTYIDGIASVLPDPKTAGNVSHVLGGPSSPSPSASPGPNPNPKPTPPTPPRNVLIPRSFVLTITGEDRINTIYRELQTLDVGRYRNAVAVLFRTFLEMSLDAYKSRNSVPTTKKWEDMRLFQKAQAVSDFMEKAAVLTKDQLKPFRVMVDHNNAYSSINTLNAYVHNRHYQPIASELIDTWERVKHVFEKLWE